MCDCQYARFVESAEFCRIGRNLACIMQEIIDNIVIDNTRITGSKPSQEAKLMPNKRDTICRYYSQGSCRYGNSCYFLHQSGPLDISHRSEDRGRSISSDSDQDTTRQQKTPERRQHQRRSTPSPERRVKIASHQRPRSAIRSPARPRSSPTPERTVKISQQRPRSANRSPTRPRSTSRQHRSQRRSPSPRRQNTTRRKSPDRHRSSKEDNRRSTYTREKRRDRSPYRRPSEERRSSRNPKRRERNEDDFYEGFLEYMSKKMKKDQ